VKRETETTQHTYQLPLGKLHVTKIFAVYREHYSGKNQVFQKKLEQVKLQADGDWLTDDMAADLAAWMLEGKHPPKWLEEAQRSS